MIKTVSAYKLRTNLGEIINEVYYKNSEVIVERKGKPLVKLVPYSPDKTEDDTRKRWMKFAGTMDKGTAELMKAAIKEHRSRPARGPIVKL